MFLDALTMGTINRGLQYVNYVNERAIRDPKWFWGDTEDAQQAREFLYNLKDGVNLINEIYDNTPPEIQKTISYKKLPTNRGGAGSKKMEAKVNTRDQAAPYIAAALAAPVAAGQALAAGAAGTLAGIGGSYLGSEIVGNWGRRIGEDLLIGNNRSYNYVDENGVPTVVGSWGQTGENIGNVVGSIGGGFAGSALGEAAPFWVKGQTAYGRALNNRRVGNFKNFMTGVMDSERGLLYGRPNGYKQKGNFMSRWGLRGNNGRFTTADYALRSRNLSNPLGQKGERLYGKGSHVVAEYGESFFPSSGNWGTISGDYEPMGGLFVHGNLGEGVDNSMGMPDFRYPTFAVPIEAEPIAKRPVSKPVPIVESLRPSYTPISEVLPAVSPTYLDSPSGIIGNASDNPTIKELRARNRDMRRGVRDTFDNPETETNERRDARSLARRENSERRDQIRDMRKQIRDLRSTKNRILENGAYMEDQGIQTDYRDLATSADAQIASIRGRRRQNDNQMTRSFNKVAKDLQ